MLGQSTYECWTMVSDTIGDVGRKATAAYPVSSRLVSPRVKPRWGASRKRVRQVTNALTADMNSRLGRGIRATLQL